MNEYRLDNVIREIGKSAGHPEIGDFVADLTVAATVAAAANEALNTTRLGRYPRGSMAGPAGSPTSWQHGATMRLRRALGMSGGNRWLSDVGKKFGRAATKASRGLLVFEGGYTFGNAIACSNIARQ